MLGYSFALVKQVLLTLWMCNAPSSRASQRQTQRHETGTGLAGRGKARSDPGRRGMSTTLGMPGGRAAEWTGRTETDGRTEGDGGPEGSGRPVPEVGCGGRYHYPWVR